MEFHGLGWLAGLFGSAFVSATILPGNSEAALLALLHFQPQSAVVAVLVATLGNVLGGLTTVWMGRRLPVAPEGRAVNLARRFGPVSLLLSWLPLVGDALCGVAGWLRWPLSPVVLWITLGKALRYALLAALSLHYF
ncbi:MAG: DedA family protein [Formivibrio sp.]|nr:DedA family protein [Formivibrio sp.]